MSLTFSLLKPPLPTHTNLSSLHATSPLLSRFSSLTLTPPPPQPSFSSLTIRAMRSMQGKVICATNDKTVSVEVTRLAPHPKYKRRVRIKKKYQAHDPDNFFKVGDWVQLDKCRPISKTKAFLAVPAPLRNSKPKPKPKPNVEETSDLGLPLQSQAQDTTQ